MACGKSLGIRETLTSLLPQRELEALAKESGMLCRRRKIDPAAMLGTLVRGFAADKLAGLSRYPFP